MIALDANVLIRYLLDDDRRQAKAARDLLSRLAPRQPGFICREVTLELAWVLQRTYGFPRKSVAEVLEELVATEELVFEAVDDVIPALIHYGQGGPICPIG